MLSPPRLSRVPVRSFSERKARRLRGRILNWGARHSARYPWRNTSNTYRVFVAESMLLRTQAAQVRPIYERFVSACPTLHAAVAQNKRHLLAILRPLGLRWRARALIRALHSAWSRHHRIPPDRESLLAMAGVGPYIANATVCFTKNIPLPLIDANTVRVIGRVYGLDLQGEARRRPDVIAAVAGTCSRSRPRDFYYALIDLAHTVCTPRDPKCAECPLRSSPCVFARSIIPSAR